MRRPIKHSKIQRMPPVYGSVLDEVRAERCRQIDVEGWTAEHDDAHTPGELSDAAACYAAGELVSALRGHTVFSRIWPWEDKWWKPRGRRYDLIRAAALIVAEIERFDRVAARFADEGTKAPSPEQKVSE